MNNFKEWILARARERSTWLGLTALLTSLGLALSPEQSEAIAVAGVAVGGLIATLTADNKNG